MEKQYIYALVEQGTYEEYQVAICKVAVEDKDKFTEFCELISYYEDTKLVVWTEKIEVVAKDWGISTPEDYKRAVTRYLKSWDLSKTIIRNETEYYAHPHGSVWIPKRTADPLIKALEIQFSE